MIHIRRRILGRYDAKKLGWLHAARTFLILVAVLFLIFRFVIGVSIVSGVSMMNTLKDGDPVFFMRIHGPVERGQIIAVSLPSGEHYVKRIAAVSGDTVDIRGGKLYVNGEAEEADYVVGETLAEDGAFAYPLTIAEGDIFVLGDNRRESIDSRFFGPISVRQITGVLWRAAARR